MTAFDPQTKPCHYCGQPVKISSYWCPHCNRSLATADQQEWEQSDPSTESSEESHDRQEPGSGIRISPAAVVVCLLLIAGAIIYGLFLRAPEKDKELPAVFTRPARTPAASAVEKTASEKTPFITIRDDADSAAKDISASATAPGSSEIKEAESIRQEKIQQTAAQILEDLQKEEAKEIFTVRLTSGREIKCDSVSESETEVTVKLAGLTATLDRDSIESIEHQSAEAAAKEREQTVLPLATRIVDEGLVRDGSEWVTPEEKARRVRQSQARQEPEPTIIPESEAPESPSTEPVPAIPREITNKEQLAALLSLVREKKVIDADFFGGTLHVEDRSGQWLGGDDEDSSVIAFEAQAERIDLAQLCRFLELDLDTEGMCEANADGGVDKRDPKTLTGETRVTCNAMTIPPIDLSPFLSPPNRNAVLSAGLLAENGTITIASLQLVGTAYNIVGGGTIKIAAEPEQSPINGTFRVTLKEAPTLVNPTKSGASMQYLLAALAGSETEIDVTLSGPISDPNVELVADSVIGSIAFQIDK